MKRRFSLISQAATTLTIVDSMIIHRQLHTQPASGSENTSSHHQGNSTTSQQQLQAEEALSQLLSSPSHRARPLKRQKLNNSTPQRHSHANVVDLDESLSLTHAESCDLDEDVLFGDCSDEHHTMDSGSSASPASTHHSGGGAVNMGNTSSALSFTFDDFVDTIVGADMDFHTPHVLNPSLSERLLETTHQHHRHHDSAVDESAQHVAGIQDVNSEQEHSSDEDSCSSSAVETENFFRDLLTAEWKHYRDECRIGSLRSNAKLKFHDRDQVLVWRPKKVIRILLRQKSPFKSLKAALYYRKPKSDQWILSDHTNEFCATSNLPVTINPKDEKAGWMEIKHLGKFVPKKMAALRANNIFYKLSLLVQFDNELPLEVSVVFKIDNNKTYQNGITRIDGLTVDANHCLETTPTAAFGENFEHNSLKHMSLRRIGDDETCNFDELVDVIKAD